MAEKKCLRCNEVIPVGERPNKIFCSRVCQTRYTSYQSYSRRKDTPEYKSKRKAYFDVWRARNKEHFNELMRKYNKKHQQDLRDARVKAGTCLSCGKERDDSRVHCSKCRLISKGWKSSRKLAKKQKAAEVVEQQ